MIKVAIIISHPIQHFCPQYASYAQLPGVDLKVFFGSRLGVDAYQDKNFGTNIKWDNLYLEEFNHLFLNEKVIQADKHIDALNLESELNTFDPDYIIINGYFQKLQQRAFDWATTSNVKLLYISDSELLQERFIGLIYLRKLKLNKFFNRIDKFLSVGDANEFFYRFYNVPFNKLTRTFFPIDIRSYKKALETHTTLRETLFHRYNLQEDDFVICTVGKLISIKRQEDVINAILALDNNTTRRIVYFVIGNGPELEALEKKASEIKNHKIIFTGFTNPIELPAFYISSHLYIHPSEIEPHSLAISEAIFSGCPVLLSDKCGSYGPTDDVQEGYNGFTYPCGSITALASFILLFIGNSDLRNEFSSNSKKLGVAHQQLAHGVGLMNAITALQYTQ